MKLLKTAIYLLITSIVFSSCSNDDTPPAAVHEEEVITTLTVTLSPEGPGETIVMKSQDLDGDGPNTPVITVSGNLAANMYYFGTIELLNETESPADDITVEVKEEGIDHQFFYTTSSALNATTAYLDYDANGNNLGTVFSLITAEASTGSLTITLRHEPTKPNTGLSDAGGETDISASFDVVIE